MNRACLESSQTPSLIISGLRARPVRLKTAVGLAICDGEQEQRANDLVPCSHIVEEEEELHSDAEHEPLFKDRTTVSLTEWFSSFLNTIDQYVGDSVFATLCISCWLAVSVAAVGLFVLQHSAAMMALTAALVLTIPCIFIAIAKCYGSVHESSPLPPDPSGGKGKIVI